jgi:hypothetical protein
MTPLQLGTILNGIVAILLLALVGVMGGNVGVIRAAALIGGATYFHYFLGAGIESGVFRIKVYAALYGSLAVGIIVAWAIALASTWW